MWACILHSFDGISVSLVLFDCTPSFVVTGTGCVYPIYVCFHTLWVCVGRYCVYVRIHVCVSVNFVQCNLLGQLLEAKLLKHNSTLMHDNANVYVVHVCVIL